MPKASRQFSKGVWICPELKFKWGLLFHKTQTVPPPQTLHELIEVKISDFYAKTGKFPLCLTIPIPYSICSQCSWGGRTNQPHSPKKQPFCSSGGFSPLQQSQQSMVCSVQQAQYSRKFQHSSLIKKTLNFIINHPPPIGNFGPT